MRGHLLVNMSITATRDKIKTFSVHLTNLSIDTDYEIG